jgi:hypothetical protein
VLSPSTKTATITRTTACSTTTTTTQTIPTTQAQQAPASQLSHEVPGLQQGQQSSNQQSSSSNQQPGRGGGQQHTFALSAVDTQGIKDPTPVTFSWTVLTPTQAIQKLINTIDSFNLPSGTTTSLEAPLNAAIAGVARKLPVPN